MRRFFDSRINAVLIAVAALEALAMIFLQGAAAEGISPNPTNCATNYFQCKNDCGLNPNFGTDTKISTYSEWLTCNSSCSADQAKCVGTPVGTNPTPHCPGGVERNGQCIENAPLPAGAPAKCKGAACDAAPIGGEGGNKKN
jgi:hypothetical protein